MRTIARNLALGVLSAVVLAGGAGAVQADAKSGEKVFNKCKACHSTEPGKNRIGPSLAGVLGRKAGSIDTFKYSSAMADADVVWDAASLDKFLADPKGAVPGTKMTFAGLKKAEDREHLIEYLSSLSN